MTTAVFLLTNLNVAVANVLDAIDDDAVQAYTINGRKAERGTVRSLAADSADSGRYHSRQDALLFRTSAAGRYTAILDKKWGLWEMPKSAKIAVLLLICLAEGCVSCCPPCDPCQAYGPPPSLRCGPCVPQFCPSYTSPLIPTNRCDPCGPFEYSPPQPIVPP